MANIIISIDLERDISKYLKNSFLGVSEGMPELLHQFDLFGIKANFFTTSDICLKYPELMTQINDGGHQIGCHGYDHSIAYLGRETFKKQLHDISAATEIIKKTTGKSPILFRAPNFSINGDTIKVLEKLGYKIDSSTLPGRHVKKWKLFSILDYRSATTEIYNPSYSDVTRNGESIIIEVPLTENPLAKGSPLGLGFLNAYGFEKTLDAVNQVNGDYVMFLIHPWEAIDLGKYYPKLKSWLHSACSGNMMPLNRFLEYIIKNHNFSTIEEVVSDYQNKL